MTHRPIASVAIFLFEFGANISDVLIDAHFHAQCKS